mgnify:FL=1
MSGDNTSGSLSTSPSDDEGDFTPVTYKKPPRAPKHRKGRPRPRERTLIERLSSRRANLEKSDYLALCESACGSLTAVDQADAAAALLREALASKEKPEDVSSCPTPVCVVCLGLGSIADSNKSQDQYVLMQNLLEDLKPSVSLLFCGAPLFLLADPAPPSRASPTGNQLYTIQCLRRRTTRCSARMGSRSC